MLVPARAGRGFALGRGGRRRNWPCRRAPGAADGLVARLAIFALALAFTLPGAGLRDAVDPRDY